MSIIKGTNQIVAGFGGTKRSIGEVYFSQSALATDNSGALPLFTGETIASANTIYPEFYNWVLAHTELQCTSAQYEAALTTYGECAKYVIGDGSLRLPLIKNYIKAANTADGIKNIEAGLPNITGKTGISLGNSSVNLLDGAFYADSIGSGILGTSDSTSHKNIKYNASRSSAVYGKSSTVTPASTTLYPWVVAYTAAIPASTAQAAEFQQGLSGKADTNLGNTTPSQSFKEMSVGWGFPDYSTGVKISGSSYTATYKCWLIGTTLVSTLTPQELYVNGHIVGKEEGDYIDVQMPIDVGDVVTVSGGSFNNLFVYAIKGAN